MINYLDALKHIHQAAKPLGDETLALNQAINKVSASAVFSSIEVPSFNNSAMDGFALRASDIQAIPNDNPVELQVVGQIKAGDSMICTKQKIQNTACAIMTGAVLPQDYDAVVRVEDVVQNHTDGHSTIATKKQLKRGDNVRYAGEDFSIGDVIINSGELIKPAQIMALATIGATEVRVKKTPEVSLFCTGDELLENGSPTLSDAKIFNSSGPYISSLLPYFNCQLSRYNAVTDNKNNFINQLKQQLESSSPPDIILTTGGVSAGNFDFIPCALKELGASIIFHKAAIRPGKPILFAKINNSYVVGLPGNPISTAVGLRFFLYPLLRKLSMMPAEQPFQAALANPVTTNATLRYFYKAAIHTNDSGLLVVDVLSGQESFKVKPLLKANCWAVIKEGRSSYAAGEIIDVFPLYPDPNRS